MDAGSQARFFPTTGRRPDIFDYTVKTAEGRLAHLLSLKSYDPEQAADYLLFVNDRGSAMGERSEEYPVLTRNRMVTVSKREVSAESLAVPGLCTSEEAMSHAAGADYSCLPLDRRPGCGEAPSAAEAQVDEAARAVEAMSRRARGRRRYLLKRQAIAIGKSRALVRGSERPGIPPVPRPGGDPGAPEMPACGPALDMRTLMPSGRGTLCDEDTVRQLLRHRWRLPQQAPGTDLACLLMDLDRDVAEAYRGDPAMLDLVRLKSEGRTNAEVAAHMRSRHGADRSEQYWASTWANRVPRDVASVERRRWLVHRYCDPVAGKWKVCSRCGRTLLAHPMNFSFNTSPDGYYSICKRCRSARREGGEARA